MDREDFMNVVYGELASDPDNCRANRIIDAADEYAESVQLGTNLAEVGTDCISRQAAIDGINKLMEIHFDRKIVLKKARDVVEQLPPAQPEPCEDAVSRKAVQYLLAYFVNKDKYDDACDGLKHLPSVTPKQRTGKWIPVGMVEAVGGESAQWGSAIAYHKCSVCNEQALRDDFEQEVLSDFCPHCGRRMERRSE